jgi:hypothetical protein
MTVESFRQSARQHDADGDVLAKDRGEFDWTAAPLNEWEEAAPG